MSSKYASVGQFYGSLSGIVFKKPTYSMAMNKSPSHFPAFHRKILTMHYLIYTQLPNFFLLVREEDLDLRPPQAMLLRHANIERTKNGGLGLHQEKKIRVNAVA